MGRNECSYYEHLAGVVCCAVDGLTKGGSGSGAEFESIYTKLPKAFGLKGVTRPRPWGLPAHAGAHLHHQSGGSKSQGTLILACQPGHSEGPSDTGRDNCRPLDPSRCSERGAGAGGDLVCGRRRGRRERQSYTPKRAERFIVERAGDRMIPPQYDGSGVAAAGSGERESAAVRRRARARSRDSIPTGLMRCSAKPASRERVTSDSMP